MDLACGVEEKQEQGPELPDTRPHWVAHGLCGLLFGALGLMCLVSPKHLPVEQAEKLAMQRYYQKINEGRWLLVSKANADNALSREQIHRMQLVYEQTFDPKRVQNEGVCIRQVMRVVSVNDTYCCRGVVTKRYALSHEFCCEIDSDIAVKENEYLRAYWRRIQSPDLLLLSGEKLQPDSAVLPIQLEDD